MLRASATPRGHCANCAVSEWFVLHEEIARIGDLPAALLIKPVQDQFAKVMISAGADMKPAEINWEKVVEHWALPFPEHARKKRGRRPR